MMETKDHQLDESIVKSLVEKSNLDDYSYDDWISSKKKIRDLYEVNAVPNHLRYTIWKHLVQCDTFSLNPITPVKNENTQDLNLDKEVMVTIKSDCYQLAQDYNLHSQIKSFEAKDSLETRIGFMNLLNQQQQEQQPLDPRYQTFKLGAEDVGQRLENFVLFFMKQTKREYSLDLVKLVIPFVVLSIVEEKSEHSVQHTEQEWMDLGLKVIDSLSNSGIHPKSISDPILLCESEMFRILLLYHDPTLANFLTQRRVYSTSYFYEWVNHMFSGCIDIKFLIQLWDTLLIHPHQDFYLFFALALLISKKEHILSLAATTGSNIELNQVLEEKTIVNSISNSLKLPGLIKNAEYLRSATPISFIRNWNKFYTHCKDPNSPKLDSINLIYLEYKYAACMGLDVEELILNSNFGKDPKVRDKFSYYIQDDQLHEFPLFVFDCRPYKHFKSGKFHESFHLPPSLLVSQPEEFERVSHSFRDMKGVTHFTFYDNWLQFNNSPTAKTDDADTNDNGDMNMNILRFLKEGYPYVSKVPSGYKKIHDIFLSKKLDLAVHSQEGCPVCNPKALNVNTPPISQPASPTTTSAPITKEKWFDKLKNFGRRRDDGLNTATATTTTAPATDNTTGNGDTPIKTAFGLFRDRLKIRDKNSLYETNDSLNNDSNTTSSASTSSNNLNSSNNNLNTFNNNNNNNNNNTNNSYNSNNNSNSSNSSNNNNNSSNGQINIDPNNNNNNNNNNSNNNNSSMSFLNRSREFLLSSSHRNLNTSSSNLNVNNSNNNNANNNNNNNNDNNNNVSQYNDSNNENKFPGVGFRSKTSFYLPNLNPFIDSEDYEIFEEAKKYYYYQNEVSEYDFTLNMGLDPVYDQEKIKKAEEEMEKELKDYKGIDDWLDGSNLIFECKEIPSYPNSDNSNNNNNNNNNNNRYIIISKTEFISLIEHPKCVGYVKVDSRHSLSTGIKRVVQKRQFTNIIEFIFNSGGSDSNTIQFETDLEDGSNNNNDNDNDNDHDQETKKIFTFANNNTLSLIKSIKERS
ncbi:hypothetical protein CYY_001968 [Polysphondylium violaceum]|uniref:Rab-GAP TBC domain-containing protein n=1 Tax=Polysphondylium violaceum TaxID=133409 RepID=A0A8J4UVM3_9MYCE|nr:hypothetical protein CYY_001968 [Polysphondylium violaceum]